MLTSKFCANFRSMRMMLLSTLIDTIDMLSRVYGMTFVYYFSPLFNA